ncbi:hypothetical protein [Vibrio phage vB_pir03]|nr:hypothetical protein [Vibrio phage vB_pir03]
MVFTPFVCVHILIEQKIKKDIQHDDPKVAVFVLVELYKVWCGKIADNYNTETRNASGKNVSQQIHSDFCALPILECGSGNAFRKRHEHIKQCDEDDNNDIHLLAP